MINLLPGIDGSAAALQAERMRMAVASQNINHANTAKGLDGKPYQRQQVVFEAVLAQADGTGEPQTTTVARIETDPRPPKLIYNPGHPEADPVSGMVALPDINIHEEMADMIVASRAYEANLAVIRNAREIAAQTMNIGS